MFHFKMFLKGLYITTKSPASHAIGNLNVQQILPPFRKQNASAGCPSVDVHPGGTNRREQDEEVAGGALGY
jgi:hypothetical protein